MNIPDRRLAKAIPPREAEADLPLRLDDEERVRCEIWTRVTGYHRPLSSFNNGKQGEFHERLFFAEPR